ncbi:hypothetical protein C8R44DRAFT_730265 [Mycena epipterygia]|nr:hypothetical protein C8R44DRAFT_730265 [Mycena epipterygia]
MSRKAWRPSVQRAASGALCASELGAVATDKQHLSFAPALGWGKQRMDRTCTVKISGHWIHGAKEKGRDVLSSTQQCQRRCGVGGGLDLTLAVHEPAALERKGALGMKEHQGGYHTPCVRDHKSVEKKDLLVHMTTRSPEKAGCSAAKEVASGLQGGGTEETLNRGMECLAVRKPHLRFWGPGWAEK